LRIYKKWGLLSGQEIWLHKVIVFKLLPTDNRSWQ